MLKEIFISLREKKDNWLGFSEGEQLESKLAAELKKNGFTHLNKKDLNKEEKINWQELKEKVKGNEQFHVTGLIDEEMCFGFSAVAVPYEGIRLKGLLRKC